MKKKASLACKLLLCLRHECSDETVVELVMDVGTCNGGVEPHVSVFDASKRVAVRAKENKGQHTRRLTRGTMSGRTLRKLCLYRLGDAS